MTTALLTHADCHGHVNPPGAPEQVARLHYILKALDGLELSRFDAPMGTSDQAKLVHDAAYVDSIPGRIPDGGTVWLDPDTYVSATSLDAIYRAVGGAVKAVDMVLDGEAPEKAVCLIKRDKNSGPAVSDTKPDTGEQASEVSDISELSDDVSQKDESSDSANVVLEVKNLDAETDKEKTLEEVIIEDPVDSPVDSGSVASTASHASADNKEHSLEKLNSLEDLVEVVESGPKEEGLQEVDIQVDDGEPIQLKKPNEVYYEIYKAARKKAKTMRRAAIEAFLEARNIKTKFMLEDLDDSDDDDFGSDEEAFSQVSA